jgi:SOS-response transcriptional repressor LexA
VKKLQQPTERQKDLADVVAKLIKRHGYSPTLRECAAALGVNVPRAHALAHGARAAGLVEFRDGEPRTIRLTERAKS